MNGKQKHGRHRGSTTNPVNRFQKIHYEYDPEYLYEEQPDPKTTFLRDTTGSIIVYNQSPDVGFNAGINVYRGCEHGCAYCYARPTHEYLGFSAGLDFESKILVKENAAELLEKELASKQYSPQVLAMSGVTDPYQPVERKMELTRQCLEVLVRFRNPVSIITKNYLVTRDIDLLSKLAGLNAAHVILSITTMDNELRGKLEPRTSPIAKRFDALKELSQAGIPCGVLIAPVIPGLTDHDMPAILESAKNAGACYAGYQMLRLPYAVSEIFARWLEKHQPDRKEKVLNRVRAMRDGQLNDPKFGSRMKGKGLYADQVKDLYEIHCRRVGLNQDSPAMSTTHFRRPNQQLKLFDK